MEPALPTTPFGRRSLSLAQVASQMVAKQRPPEAVAHKWNIFRALCTARSRLGLSERSLTVLNALLTFHPETVLSGDDLVVFPSNEQIALRAHGMPSSTMRRHLAQLVDARLLIRRDSPNGKRYARERITLARRDIVKMIETGIEEDVPPPIGQGGSTWESVHAHFRAMLSRIPANASLQALEEAGGALTALAAELSNALENHIKQSNMGAKGARIEHHIQNSNPKPPIDLEPSLREGPGPRAEPPRKQPEPAERAYPLGMVLSACPDIIDYAKGGISHWRDLLAAAAVVRSMLGISPSAWEEAQSVMGGIQAAIVIACLLQRSATISSAGGYLRELTRKAGVGEFSLGPILMAQINARNRERKSA